MLVARGADLPAAAEDEAARRSAAQRVRSKGQLALPGCDPGLFCVRRRWTVWRPPDQSRSTT
eukprot:scaffold10282_cov44-Phaeocystis_antarctica.AAC.2